MSVMQKLSMRAPVEDSASAVANGRNVDTCNVVFIAYNAHGFKEDDAKLIADYAVTLHPCAACIIALQETWCDGFSNAVQLPGFKWFGVGATLSAGSMGRRKGGVGLFYPTVWADTAAVVEMEGDMFRSRCMVWLRLNVLRESPVFVCSFYNQADARLSQSDALTKLAVAVDFVQQKFNGRVVLLGDFNAHVCDNEDIIGPNVDKHHKTDNYGKYLLYDIIRPRGLVVMNTLQSCVGLYTFVRRNTRDSAATYGDSRLSQTVVDYIIISLSLLEVSSNCVIDVPAIIPVQAASAGHPVDVAAASRIHSNVSAHGMDTSPLLSDHKPLFLAMRLHIKGISNSNASGKQKRGVKFWRWRFQRYGAEIDWERYAVVLSSTLQQWTAFADRLIKHSGVAATERASPVEPSAGVLPVDQGAQAVIDLLWSTLCDCLLAAFNSVVGLDAILFSPQPGWDAKSTELFSKKQALHKRIVHLRSRSATPAIQAQLVLLKQQRSLAGKAFRQWRRRQCRRPFTKKTADMDRSLRQKDRRTFWRTVDRVKLSKSSRLPQEVVTSDGTVTQGQQQLRDAFRDHYSKNATPKYSAQYNSAFLQEVQQRIESALSDSFSSTCSVASLDAPSSVAECLSAMLSSCKSGTAPGVDFIRPEMLIKGDREAVSRVLHKMFNICWELDIFPSQLCVGAICPIFKKGSEPKCLSSWRPITLLPLITRILEGIFLQRLSTFVAKRQALSEEQAGFRSKRGCNDHVYFLKELLAHYHEECLVSSLPFVGRQGGGVKKQSLFMLFLDIRDAYGSVWTAGLFDCLFQIGVTGKLWRNLHTLYSRSVSRVNVNGRSTEEFEVRQGVKQGSPLSPLLYALFIDGLIRELKNSKVGAVFYDLTLTTLCYADDIVLLANTLDDLLLLRDIAERYAAKFRFDFNPSKVKLLCAHFPYKRKWSPLPADIAALVTIGGVQVEEVESFRYLGIDIERNGNASKVVCSRLTASAKAVWFLWSNAGAQYGGFSAAASAVIWLASVRSILEYGSEVWQPNSVAMRVAIAAVQKSAAGRVLHVRQSCPAELSFAELGWLPMAVRFDMLLLGF